MCLEGEFSIVGVDGASEKVHRGESVLLPAEESEVTLDGGARLLEVYIK